MPNQRKRTSPSWRIAVTILLAGMTAEAALDPTDRAQAAEKRRVLLVYQSPDGHPRSTHEYESGIRLMARLLDRDARLSVAVVNGDEPWSDGPDLIAGSSVVFLFVSHGGRWIQNDPGRLKAFNSFAEQGGGLVCLHWGMGARAAEDVPAFVDLFGACHGGPDRKYKVVTGRCVPHASHRVMQGIKPFELEDEFYYRLKRTTQPGLEPLLTVRIDGHDEMVAWAWERPNKGRSFGFSGLHFHRNWRQQEYRQMLVQAVLWTSKSPIPEQLQVPIENDWLKLPEAKPATKKN